MLIGFQGDPKVDKNRYALPIAKGKGSTNTNQGEENGRCKGGPLLTPKPKPKEGKKVQKGKTKRKKGTTFETRNATLGPILATKGRNGPNFTTNMNDHIGKGVEGDTKAKVGTKGRGKEGTLLPALTHFILTNRRRS
jgi:hypothetical protein